MLNGQFVSHINNILQFITNLLTSEATVPSELADFFCNFVRFSEPHCELAGELLCDDGLNELLSEPGDWRERNDM